MNVQETKNCFQLMVNSYRGGNGKVVPLNDSETFHVLSDGNFKVEFIQVQVGDTIYICFQGSNGFWDWFKNIQKNTSLLWDCEVHDGFMEMFQIFLHKHYMPNLDVFSTHRIIFTGHSQGGAIATLAAFHHVKRMKTYLDAMGREKKEVLCVPIASPRVGKKEFVKEFNRLIPNTLVYRYGWDFVTTVPWQIGGYKHVGTLVQLGEKSLFPRFTDHYPHNYVRGLEELIRRDAADYWNSLIN